MSIRNFDAIITNKGNPIKDETGVAMTQKAMIYNLLMGFQGTAGIEKKLKMATIAKKMLIGGNIDLSVEELSIIRECLEPLPPLSLSQICESLEADIPAKKK